MKLTGKCKEDFEKWYELKDYYYLDFMPLNMVYGVYVDFFDSYDMFIYVVAVEKNCGDFAFRPEIIGCYGDHDGIYHTTRQEARIEAIEKANEIYNGQHPKQKDWKDILYEECKDEPQTGIFENPPILTKDHYNTNYSDYIIEPLPTWMWKEEINNLKALLKSTMEAYELILLDNGIKRSTSNIAKKEITKIKTVLER